MAVDANSRIRVLSDAECWQRLAEHPAGIGRVGTGGPSPDILPVTYVLDGHSVVFRTGQGRKLAAVGAQERIAFEVDDVDAARRTGWSVVLRGFAERVTDPEEIARLDALGLQPWDPSPKGAVVRIATRMVDGREIS